MRRALVIGAMTAAATAACSLFLSTDDLTDGSGAGDAATFDGPATGTDAHAARDTSPDAPPDDAASDAPRSYREEVLADGPLLYLRFDEKTGVEAFDEVADAAPSLYMGAHSIGEPGAFDASTAVRFDGGSGGVLAGDRWFDGRKPYTLEGWLRPDAVDTAYRFMANRDMRDDAGRQSYGIWLQEQHGLEFERYVDGTKRSALTTLLALGTYHHVVGAYDGSVLRLYVDGMLAATDVDERAAPFVDAGAFWIGRVNMNGPSLIGALDEFAVYDVALPSARVQAHYLAAKR